MHQPSRGGELHSEFLRLGLAFADGRKATNLRDRLNEALLSEHREPPEGPALKMLSGHGSGCEYSMRYWTWPLPPSGPLTFVCEWPSEALPLTRVEIDGKRIVEAAAAAHLLWGESEEWFGFGDGGGGGGIGVVTAELRRADESSEEEA